ncbi:DUF323-domain-containing protein [Basidiobolus meristosporus CBS 931.73]|uniref:DUF323-domain-containing protein n=1 Tax=Basidiobolus meristosporus CBS 931.73 TaxID=1314790 RepID=A0A1Y1YK44_9FUNG|nr:DUF323-domain-containing protein [Basidiobolus meristosporus CBS 931.73]|eukprot:ORX98381.1 DUF323-domain-containing protein [Basidiobolus meristosporus CBS 931.73]
MWYLLLLTLVAAQDITILSGYSELQTSLSNLASSISWDGQGNCAEPHFSLIPLVDNAISKLSVVINDPQINDLKYQDAQSYLTSEVTEKLSDLRFTLDFIGHRCNASDYDPVGRSIERPALLVEFFKVWKRTVDDIRSLVASPPPPLSAPAKATDSNYDSSVLTPPGTKFVDCTDSFCPQLTVVPAGSYVMGVSAQEIHDTNAPTASLRYESPQHTVNILKPFALSTYEVTRDDFSAFVNETGYRFPKGCLSTGYTTNGSTLQFFDHLSYLDPLFGVEQRGDEPVLCVRKEDALAYTGWLSAKTGKNYRLPYESEFEYALRAGSNTVHYWGDELELACDYENVLDYTTLNATGVSSIGFPCSDGHAFTASVGSFKPNAFGLHDMAANAREWVTDPWHYNYTNAVTDGSEWSADGIANFPVLRGGAWLYNAYNVRSRYRNAYLNSQARSNMWGFRVARDL